ncbi:MAG: glycosyltransferase family 4 protein [Pseudomonadota bacterium]
MSNKGFRLLYISSDKFPPFRVDVAVLFGKKMVVRGNRIDWVLQSDKDLGVSKKEQWWGGEVYVGSTNNQASILGKLSKILKDLVNDFRVINLAVENDYDFIQVKDKFIATLFAIYAAKKNNAKFIYWLSYPFPEAYLYRYQQGTARFPILNLFRGKFFKWLLYKYIMIKADHVFLQSEQMKRDVIAEGVDENKLTSIPMGVEISSVPYDENFQESDSDELKVVYLGTLTRVRKMDFLIRAFSEVVHVLPNAKLYLVGSGDYESDINFLKQEVLKYKLTDSVVFTGFLPMEKAWEYVKEANVCVSPFYPTPILNSTSPTKLIEYMAMAKAVVANDHPEQGLVINESKAGICVPYEEKSFGQAIVTLLRNPVLAKEMGQRGRLYAVENRSYDVIADKLDAYYCSILADSVGIQEIGK